MPLTMKSRSPGFTNPISRASRASAVGVPAWAIRRSSSDFSLRSSRTSARRTCSWWRVLM